MKLVNSVGQAVTKKEVTLDVLKYTGKSLLWTVGLWAAAHFATGFINGYREQTRLNDSEEKEL